MAANEDLLPLLVTVCLSYTHLQSDVFLLIFLKLKINVHIILNN